MAHRVSGKGPQASLRWRQRLEGNLSQAALLTSDPKGMTEPQSHWLKYPCVFFGWLDETSLH